MMMLLIILGLVLVVAALLGYWVCHRSPEAPALPDESPVLFVRSSSQHFRLVNRSRPKMRLYRHEG